MINTLARITDTLEHLWEEVVMKRAAGIILVWTYLIVIVLVEVNRQGWMPHPFSDYFPESHFFAVQIAFTLLLITEVVSLIFGLTRSFSRSIGIQLEILALILVRDTFKKLSEFGEPLQWDLVRPELLPMVGEALGALAIFVILGLYYRMQHSYPISDDEREQKAYINSKKVIALGLVVVFTLIGLVDIYRFFTSGETYPFFDSFYTVLIFTDVLMVLLSLQYSTRFAVTFRNFGYAVVTVFIRIALIAPPPLNAGIGIGTALFALAMAMAYNQYGRDIIEQAEKPDEFEEKTTATMAAVTD